MGALHGETRRRGPGLVALGAAGVLAVSWMTEQAHAASSLAATSASPPNVAIQASDFRFCAATATTCLPTDSAHVTTVVAGTRVLWRYQDSECDAVVVCPGHNVAFGRTVSKTVKSDGALLYSAVFRIPGSYSYFCTIHQVFGMTGKIIVTAAARSTPTAVATAPAGSPAGTAAPTGSGAAAVSPGTGLPLTGGSPWAPVIATALLVPALHGR
ncbi:MAG TPA: plastocyanin/azurin family copper-binding protein, partial [Mycobacteriales bacterium]|nr:plastocyanin/azurin family copper-binding protein [Mycobacteriales bacterium]